MRNKIEPPRVDDALQFLIGWIRNPRVIEMQGSYGYNFLLSLVIKSYLMEESGINRTDVQAYVSEVSTPFLAAAWELCRMGIIRLGVSALGGQITPEGSGGDGYSVTPYGKRWLEEKSNDIFIPTEYGRFAELLDPFKTLFGPGFHERAQQANRCYRARAFLACCAMCGAAAESIMLALAIEKDGDEEKVLKQYASAGGRGRIAKNLIGQVDKRTKEEFDGLVDPINYWRDESAHGRVSNIGDNEAYIVLSKLLRFAAFCRDNYQALTGKPLP